MDRLKSFLIQVEPGKPGAEVSKKKTISQRKNLPIECAQGDQRLRCPNRSMVVVCWPVLMWLVAGWDPTFCGWRVNVVNCEMSRDVIWCVFILCDAISCVLWCHMMHWDVMWWLLCDATPTCENGMVMRKHITSTPKPLDKQKSDSTTSQIQTATTISQNSMIKSELRACQAVHSDKLGIKTWPNQHDQISASWGMSSQCQGQHLHPASSAHPGLTTQVCGLMHQITVQVQITVHSIYVGQLRKHITGTPKPLDKQ